MIKFNIYIYLQPEAVKLFNTLPCFREKYLKSIAALGGEGFKNLCGEALSSLVRDYLEETVDWDGSQGIADLYRSAFILARKFVLPMNPPRVELDHALKIIFAEHGLHVKRTRFSGYNHRKSNSGTIATEKQDSIV